MCSKTSDMKYLYVPTLHLGHLKIKVVENGSLSWIHYFTDMSIFCIIIYFFQRKGYCIIDMSDVYHIIKQIRKTHARWIMLMHNFKHCTVNVKITLLIEVYTVAPMWITFRKKYC